MDKKILGAVLIAISAMLWGIDGVVLTPNLFKLDVGFVVLMLHLIPFVIMNIFLWKEYKNMKTFTRSDWLFFMLIAIFGGALGTLAIVKALFLVNFQSLSIVVLIQKLQPVFGILLATILLKEKLSKNFIFWATIAIISSYTLTFGLGAPNLTSSNLGIAALWSLIAAISFGSATVFGKKILNKYSFSTSTFFRFGFTAFIMFFYVLLFSKFQFLSITNQNWMYFIIIAFTTGSGAIFMYYYGLNKVSATISTICELFFPITAIILDFLIFKTTFTLVQWVSAAVMIGAIIKISVGQKSIKKIPKAV